MMHGWYVDGWWGVWLMWIFMILFWSLIIVAIVLLIRWLASRPFIGAQPGGLGRESAIEILKKRYAQGEITREQFQEMLRDLEEHPEPPGQ
ncbi:MAG: SHOCT domain-containing protein [Armatimonadota bacterium]